MRKVTPRGKWLRLKQAGGLAWLLLALGCSAPAVRAGPATATLVPQGNGQVAVLENDWIRLTVNPAQGGRVSSFIVKRTGREMVTSKDSGLLMDHFYEQNWPGEFLYVPYDMAVVEAGPQQASVRVTHLSTGKWGGSVNPGVAGIEVIKTLTLPADRPVVECEVELKNTDTSTKAFTYWQQNCYRADGDSGAVSRQIMTRPSAGGLHVVAPANDWTKDVVAGWTAGVDPQDRVGLVFLMDYNVLSALYNCGLSSSEYFYDKMLLPGGMSWTTRSSAVLVEGLQAVVYASPRFSADLQVSAQGGALSVEHTLVAPVALGHAKVTTTLAGLNRTPVPGAQPSVSEVDGLGLQAQSVTAQFPGQAGKPVIIQVSVEGDGWKESYEFAYAGKGTGQEVDSRVAGYALPAPPKHQQIITPPALTKVHNSQPRILDLRGLYYQFGHVDEAAQALGPCDLTVSWYKDIGDIQMLSILPWDYSTIMQWDVIAFNNIGYGAMVGEQGAGMLKAYVENGGSVLFLGGPQAFGLGGYTQSAALQDLLPVTLADTYDLRPMAPGTHLAAVPGSPAAAVDWGPRPPVAMWMHHLAAKPGADVWLRAGDEPALVTQTVGKGRVAVVLLTPLGEPGRGETPYWESPGWTPLMTAVLRWLVGG
jgi:hypothetical protein